MADGIHCLRSEVAFTALLRDQDLKSTVIKVEVHAMRGATYCTSIGLDVCHIFMKVES
jgi:hypothetical protein